MVRCPDSMEVAMIEEVQDRESGRAGEVGTRGVAALVTLQLGAHGHASAAARWAGWSPRWNLAAQAVGSAGARPGVLQAREGVRK